MTIRAEISSDTIATSCEITINSGSPVLSLCRRLVAEGCNPTTPLQAFRGDTLCLTVRSIGEAAGLRVSTAGTGFMTRQEPTSAPYSDFPAPEAVRQPRSPKTTLTTPSSLAA
jgi:hypothetical protein